MEISGGSLSDSVPTGSLELVSPFDVTVPRRGVKAGLTESMPTGSVEVVGASGTIKGDVGGIEVPEAGELPRSIGLGSGASGTSPSCDVVAVVARNERAGAGCGTVAGSGKGAGKAAGRNDRVGGG